MVVTIALTRACLRACQADLGRRALSALNLPPTFPRIVSLAFNDDAIAKLALPVLSAGVAPPPSIVGLSFAGYDKSIGCGGVAVCTGDVMVCDNDGAVVIPAPMVAEVAEAGIEQQRFERFGQQRVAQGASVVGLYPPDEGTLVDHQRWLAAGEP